MMGIADMEMKTRVGEADSTRADRVKRGFNRIALVGAVVAGVFFVWAVGWYSYLLATLLIHTRRINTLKNYTRSLPFS